MNPLDEYICSLTPEQSALTEYVRRIILSSHHGIEEDIKYGIPFFMLNGWLCYINPKKHELDIGFPRAQHFHDPTGELRQKGRKMVKTLSYSYTADIDPKVLTLILQEAIAVNLQWNTKQRS